MTTELPIQPISAREKMTENEIAYISNLYKNKDGEYAFEKLFKEKTKSFCVSSELVHKKMREWLNNALMKIPFSNLNVDEDTYFELCSLECEKMEWGVLQKVVQILLGLSPDTFGINEDVERQYNCLHSAGKRDELKFCSICGGGGFIKGEGRPRTKDELILLSSAEMVKNLKTLNKYIIDEVGKIRMICIEEIWYGLNDREKYDCRGQIAKLTQKKQPQPTIVKP